MNNEIINIAYCTDSNYLEHVSVSIQSIILNNLTEKMQFHVFLYNVQEEYIEKFKNTSKLITIYKIEEAEVEKYHHDFSTKHISNSTFIRLMVPKLLANKVNRLLYLDADILCFANISPIFDINIDNYICAAGNDSNKKEPNPNLSRLKLNTSFYFNAGVLFINISNWVAFNVEEKTNKILFENRLLKYADQDALNITLQNRVLLIDSKWNYLFTWMTAKQKETFFYNKHNLPYFIHFTGPRKMWYQEHDGLAQNLYNFYKHFTPWSNLPLQSYRNKMRVVDYRIYAIDCFKKGFITQGIINYINYLTKKIIK